VTYYVLFFIEAGTRRVSLGGITRYPDSCWMEQVARNATMQDTGYLNGCRYLLYDRDKKFCREFRETLAACGVECTPIPPGTCRGKFRFMGIFARTYTYCAAIASPHSPGPLTFFRECKNNNKTTAWVLSLIVSCCPPKKTLGPERSTTVSIADTQFFLITCAFSGAVTSPNPSLAGTS
jgi:hypothetical protein